MSQAPYSWTFVGNCPTCGSPIYGRVTKAGGPTKTPEGFATGLGAFDQPEAQRTCPPSCPYGAKTA